MIYSVAIVEAIEANDVEVGMLQYDEYAGEHLRGRLSGGVFVSGN